MYDTYSGPQISGFPVFERKSAHLKANMPAPILYSTEENPSILLVILFHRRGAVNPLSLSYLLLYLPMYSQYFSIEYKLSGL